MLRSVYWREELLEVVLWLRGEGFDEHLDRTVVRRFLGLDDEQAAAHLERLADHGYLQRQPDGRYALSPVGEEEAQRLVGGPRSVPAPAPGSCGPDCWCPTSPVEASRCADLA